MQETWGDNMKDRTPKFPGRVKLKPVAGQTDTYDMTRADDPDDTGTPFNTRTMLQDSTGRFLRLPVSNPFVDDALRHMPDRIEPIGTVKTSPALSLGDAWLKCDGSQVTFAEYPALCQLLRGTSSAVWDGNKLGVSALVGTVSRPVYFDGRWIIALLKPSIGGGTNYRTYPFVILSAPTLDGTWTQEYTVNKNSFNYAQRLFIACTEGKCVVLMTTGAYGSMKIEAFCCTAGSNVWTNISVLSAAGGSIDLYGFDSSGSEFAFVANNTTFGDALIVYYTSTPDVASSWTASSNVSFVSQPETTSFNHANGNWVICGVTAYNNSSDKVAHFQVSVSADASGFAFATKELTVPKLNPGANAISDLVYMNGRYYVLFDGYAELVGSTTNNVILASSTDLENWEYQVVEKNTGYDNNGETCVMAANTKMLVFGNKWHTWTAADPQANINEAELPSGSVPEHFTFVGDTAFGVTASAIIYHDYSTDARLLPTISLSDDTTTFIKAKNELDVFEAGG